MSPQIASHSCARQPAFHRAVCKFDAMLLHQLLFLFGDRLADHVRFARFIARQIRGDANDLFLIDDDAVRIF